MKKGASSELYFQQKVDLKHKILVVDDEAVALLSCQKQLEAEGYAVNVAGNGPEALKQVKENRFDLVVLDIKMPQMDGMDILGKLTSIRPGLPVVLYTAYDYYRDNFMSWAADAYIMKSPGDKELLAKIKELLRGRFRKEMAA